MGHFNTNCEFPEKKEVVDFILLDLYEIDVKARGYIGINGEQAATCYIKQGFYCAVCKEQRHLAQMLFSWAPVIFLSIKGTAKLDEIKYCIKHTAKYAKMKGWIHTYVGYQFMNPVTLLELEEELKNA